MGLRISGAGRGNGKAKRAAWICGFLAGAAIFQASCGNGNPPVNTQPITLFITQDPPATLAVNATASIAATVTNDPLHRGVLWSCVPLNLCGTLSPIGTASGVATTYTAPSQRTSVTITATAAGNSSAAQSVTINITSMVTVTISQPPPTTIQAEATAPVTATVTGDSANLGVDWSCSPAGSCGSLTPAHTASGAASTFTAPATAGTVTITATSTADKTSFAAASTAVFTVISVGNLSGNYAFYLSGEDKNHHAFSEVGAVLLDGKGGVTGGELDVNNGAGTISPEPTGDTITGGTYALGQDGQGTLTLQTSNAAIGVGGTETLALTRVSDQHVLVTEFDTGATASGSLDSQTFLTNGNTGQISGGYSFVLSGAGSGGGLVEGGVFSSTGGGLLNSVELDEDIAGVTNLGIQSSGTYAAPDDFGRGRATFNGLNFSYYIIGIEALRMIETDGSRVAVGSAFGQGALAGSASMASLNGNFVFTLTSGSAGALFSTAGIMSPNGRGKMPGFADVNETSTSTISSATYTGNYTLGTNGYGRIAITPGNTQDVATIGLYAIDPQINLSDPNNPNGGGGALLADLDANLVGSGAMIPQFSGTTVKASFAVGLQGLPAAGEEDFGGAGTISLGGPITGTGSWNQPFTAGQTTGVPFSVTLTTDVTHTGRLTASVQYNSGATVQNFVFYQATNQLLIGAEIDPRQPGTGTLQQQR